MTKIEKMVCPGCGAPLHFDDPEQEYCYCSHCGIQVYKDNNKKYYTYREINDAKIEEQKVKELEIKSRERMVILILFLFIPLLIFLMLALIKIYEMTIAGFHMEEFFNLGAIIIQNVHLLQMATRVLTGNGFL